MYDNFILPSIMDFDDLFSRTPNKVVFNDIMLNHSTDDIVSVLCDISNSQNDSVASCECGALVGNYYDGVLCRICRTTCQLNLFSEIRNDGWLAVPSSIKGILNPQVFRILDNWIGNNKKKQSILKSILDMHCIKEPIPNTPFFSGMGFNWFYDNFDTIINTFLYNHPSKSKKKLSNSINAFLKQTGDAIWCHYLPVLSKFIQPITRMNEDVRYADPDIRDLMKSIFTLRSVLLAERTMRFSVDHIDRNFFRVYSSFLIYLKNIQYLRLPRKESVFRKHVFGSRSHCSGRTVAIPIVDPHDSDEIYLPWKIGVTMYRYHIISVLRKRYNIPKLKAYNRTVQAINIYDFEIDKIMQGLIRDCPYKGLPILVNRNPSLRLGSIQLMYVTKIKPGFENNPIPEVCEETYNPLIEESSSAYLIMAPQKQENPEQQRLQGFIEDSSVSVSPLIVKGPNLDLL